MTATALRALWMPDALTSAMGAIVLGPAPGPVNGVSIDTRTLAPGDLFFAIRGDSRDGHDFVAAALEKGAAAAVVAQDRAAEFDGKGCLLAVPDVLDAMVALGRAARARTDAQVVAVTGSVGKTGTKEAMRTVLARQGASHASVASYNNHWGVPLTLARMPAETGFAVIEIGMNHPGEIAPLARLARFFGVENPSFFESPEMARLVIMALDAWTYIPFMMIMILAGLQAIPKEVQEASRVDGANAWRGFWEVTFPLMLPVSITAILIRIIFKLKLADIIINVTSGGPGGATDSVTSFIFREYRDRSNVGYGTMLAMVYLLLIIIFMTVLMKLVDRWMRPQY